MPVPHAGRQRLLGLGGISRNFASHPVDGESNALLVNVWVRGANTKGIEGQYQTQHIRAMHLAAGLGARQDVGRHANYD